MEQDCICALATSGSGGALSIIRISGKGTKELVENIFAPKQAVFPLQKRKVYYGEIRDNGIILDEVLLWYFPAPYSYTGEEMAEISCHGSLYIQQQLLELLIRNGCRMAQPGEFTSRAFLNGKMDLSQAEAVADIIASTSKASHKLAFSQLRGGYAKELSEMRAEFIRLVSLLELELDFSEEDVEFADRKELKNLVSTLYNKIEQLLGSFQMGNALKKGIPVAIIGRPNAGKSTLLNALLADDRAIVSPIPGTTRDTIEECMTIEGISFRFIDTAGLRNSDDPIESLGLARSIKAAQEAQIILYVRDITLPFDQKASDDITFVTGQCDIKGKHLFIVHNRCDLPHTQPSSGNIISAKESIGIEQLKTDIVSCIKNDIANSDGILLTNIRHYEALKHVLEALKQLQTGLENGRTPDLMSMDARDAINYLGEITGEVTNNDILTAIFSKFCIGK